MAEVSRVVKVQLDTRVERQFAKLIKAVQDLTNYSGAKPAEPEEYYDDQTLFKVHAALRDTLWNCTRGPEDVDGVVNDCISAMQNAGIKFREVRGG